MRTTKSASLASVAFWAVLQAPLATAGPIYTVGVEGITNTCASPVNTVQQSATAGLTTSGSIPITTTGNGYDWSATANATSLPMDT